MLNKLITATSLAALTLSLAISPAMANKESKEVTLTDPTPQTTNQEETIKRTLAKMPFDNSWQKGNHEIITIEATVAGETPRFEQTYHEAEVKDWTNEFNKQINSASDGNMTATHTQHFNVGELTAPSCNLDRLKDQALTKIGVDPSFNNIGRSRKHYLLLLPAYTDCYAGLAYVNASFGYITYNSILVFAHELLHQFNISHASTLKCAAIDPKTPASGSYSDLNGECVYREYGDSYDVMGNVSVPALTALGPSIVENFGNPTSVTHIQPGTQKLNPIGGTGTRIYRYDSPEQRATYYIYSRTEVGMDTDNLPSNISPAGVFVKKRLWDDESGRAVSLTLNNNDNLNALIFKPNQKVTLDNGKLELQFLGSENNQHLVKVTIDGNSGTTQEQTPTKPIKKSSVVNLVNPTNNNNETTTPIKESEVVIVR